MTSFRKYKPYMAYLTEASISQLKKYSEKKKIPISQLIREGVISRISGNGEYSDGYNDGITKAISAIHDLQFAQMKFPSGASFAETIEEELVKHLWRPNK